MKPRPAAALALVGWYLMTAPVKNIGPFIQIERKAPMSQWDRGEQFDTKKQREAARSEYLAYPPTPLRNMKDSLLAECVASDDPRLKGN
jgi:hypothetical protein